MVFNRLPPPKYHCNVTLQYRHQIYGILRYKNVAYFFFLHCLGMTIQLLVLIIIVSHENEIINTDQSPKGFRVHGFGLF